MRTTLNLSIPFYLFTFLPFYLYYLLSIVKEVLGGAQLVAHNAEELLALLQDVEVEQRHLEVGVVGVTIHHVDNALTHH